MLSDTVNYRWTDGSKEEIVDVLCNETILIEITNFETKTFSGEQNGINFATEELNSVLGKIADKSCKKVRKRKNKRKLLRQKWSDISIYEKRKSLNFESQCKNGPYVCEMFGMKVLTIRMYKKTCPV